MPIIIKELIVRTTVTAANENSKGTEKKNASENALIEGLNELAKMIKDKNER